ncbi:LCP family protein [Agromyces ramosus]|uniref:LCP family protein required for cell wall assembly n=1 Tax=Agromyces ramosus TaxID=33879 RepID=A0ABU0R8K3_9MICO|nr:LCP family protein [Agromyces ramosus]MDQ0894407.1 LCP family protein required for cell wall assembly [Agromyces ramosus]
MTGHMGNDMTVDTTSAPRHGRMPRHGALRSYLKLAASVIAVLAVSAAGVAAYAAFDLVGSLDSSLELENEEMLDAVPDIGAMEGGLTFLLVGSDKRPESGAFGDPEEESGELNDVTMLLHISQDHSHVEVVSFPRDMLVPVPECPDPEDPEGEPLSAMSEVKLNSVLSHGGFGCVASTIKQLTGVMIPTGGIVQFDGVAALATAVGGVEVCLAEPIVDDYAGLHLDAGTHSISGYDALAFLRSRHGVGNGSDLGRISNQQIFLASLMRTVQADGTLEDPVKLYSIAKAVTSNMQLTSALQDPARLISIAKALQDVDLSKVAFIQYPTAYTEDFSAVVPVESAELVNAALQADLPVQLDPAASDNAELGTVADPAAPPPADGAPSESTETAAPTTPVESLPPDVPGQRGDEVRCSTANDG